MRFKHLYILAVVLLAMALITPAFGQMIGSSGDASKTFYSGRNSGYSFYWYNNYLTTGDLMRLKLLDAKMTNAAAYISCLGGTGSSEVFRVGEGGVLTIAPTTAAITYDGITITGNAQTSGDGIQITFDNDALNGGKYLNCIGGTAADTAVFTVGEDGATAINSVGVATNSLSITNNLSTAGDLVTLTLDDDAADADTFYISALGGTDHLTSVFTLGESGVMTFGDGGTIDGTTGTDVLNLTETTVRATGILDVTGNSTLLSVDVGGGYSSTGLTVAATGAVTGASTALFDSTVTSGKVGSAGSVVAAGTTSGSLALTPIADGTNLTTIQNQTGGSAKVITLPSATCTLPGLGLANSWTGATNDFTTAAAATAPVSISSTTTSQTLENTQAAISLTTDSTFLTGTDITYSGGRGSSALKLTGTWSGTSGGYSNIYSNVTKSGATGAAVDGVIGIKGIVTNTGAMTDGSVYGGQFWAKHAHATADMANEAALIGLEGFAYDATSGGTVGTLIGANVGYHNEVDTAKPGGSAFRALQVVCDDAAGSDVADEATGICIWNMAGTQTDGIKFVKSDGGWTTDITLQNTETISNATDGTVAISGVTSLNPRFATIVANTDASETLTAAQSGAIVTCSAAGGATTITLPDPSAATVGVQYTIMQTANQDVIVVPTTANGNSIVSEGVATSDSVTLTHGSNKIGVGGYVVGISATQWWVGGFADTTLTVEAAD